MTTTRVLAALGLWCGYALTAVGLDAQGAPSQPQADSTFLLATGDIRRSPSPFIGNGRVGVVVPALGIGPSRSLVAGLYEHGPGDVPRIAAAPTWNAIQVFDGERWLDTAGISNRSVNGYRQVVDMRTGTARTSYDWADGDRRTGVSVEMFVSRATPRLAAIRLKLAPRQAGRMRVRFALAGRPPPHRLALAELERSDSAWKPADIWYPGHMIVRARSAHADSMSARLALTAAPEGRRTTLAQSAWIGWDRDLPGVESRVVTAHDTAMVELGFDAQPGATYTFTQLLALVSSRETARPDAAATRRLEEGVARGWDALAADNAAAWVRRWETDIVLDGDPALQRVVRSMLFYLLCSADSGTALGIPPMGLSSAGYYGHVFWDSDTWMFPALVLTHPDVARSMVGFRARTLDAARANARANGFRGAMYPWEADELGHETTPRFAAQNASSEIHVNGDVALAQWQYYSATGDSAWLAREGFPVIRGTADFWVSRADHDAARDAYHIRNVVSVAEGMIGVSDDAYTNSVARINLEIAAAASRRLGLTPDPRWTEVATKLHMPVDSVSHFFRTYEGAPDSTLGLVTPLLSYPLQVPLRAGATRAHLDQAVSRLDDEAAGAMMGITLLSVLAAELHDRSLVDTLLPLSYRAHLRGPFLLLSETPSNDAISFLTGAGGFLQQVIFGYTGLRLGGRGLEPAFSPVLPSGITRLVLRNLSVRGRRFDVVVDPHGRRILPHASAEQPVLSFPEPGLDDTAAYQGYRTRFYRDARGNTVQIYLDPRAGRVVNLWADAADESLGFTVRGPRGGPTRLAWDSGGAQVTDSGGMRVLEYRLAAEAPSLTLGWFLLGSMRVERDFQYADAQLRPFTAPPYYVAEESLLVANVARLPVSERRHQLALLNAENVAALRGRLLPALEPACGPRSCAVRVERPSLDGRNRLALELRVDPRRAALKVTGRTVSIRSTSRLPVAFTVRIATDAAALTPLPRDSIFTREFLEFVAGVRAGGPGSPRYRRLEREVRGIELLSSEEKLMAGLPNFATYFGRDMLMTALMMGPIWRPAMSEHVIASVLRKLSPRGDVSHEEALGGQAIRENAAEYNHLAGCCLDSARAVLAHLQRTRENYHMLDDEFQLPILAARYLADSAVPAARKREFLLGADGGGPARLTLLLRELALVAAETRPYAADPRPANLVSFEKRDSTHWRSASWRDSDAGYAGGRFAMDINAIWAPRALEAIATILAALPGAGVSRQLLDSLAPEVARGPLGGYLADAGSLGRATDNWNRAWRHFVVILSPDEICKRVGAKLAWLPPVESAYWRELMAHRTGATDSLAFLALSLDSAGAPIQVVNTDPATELFLDATSPRPARLDLLASVMRPYPVGLFVEGLGPLVANDAYAPRRVWETFAKDAYHSPRVVWGREVNLLLLGLAHLVERAPHPTATPSVRDATEALRRTLAAVTASGLEHNELWSYRIERGRLLPTRYGTSSDVQLWSSTDLALQYLLARLPTP